MLTSQMLQLCNEVIREHGDIPICVLTKDSNFAHIISSVSLHTSSTAIDADTKQPRASTSVLTIVRDNFQFHEHQLNTQPKVLHTKR